jgi:hypothetical protein
MVAVQFAVAQCAHKPAAAVAWENGFFAGVVKTSGFAFNQNDFTAQRRSSPPEQSGKNLDL